jgi:uncharacterized membrane protein
MDMNRTAIAGGGGGNEHDAEQAGNIGIEQVVTVALAGALLARGVREAQHRPSLGAALVIAGGALAYNALNGGPPLSQTLPRALGLSGADGGGSSQAQDIEVQRSLTVGRPADALYQLLQDPTTMTRIAGTAARVTKVGDGRTRWQAQLPGGKQATWDAELVEQRPGELLRWRTTGAAAPQAEAEVRLRPAPADWGTEVTLRLQGSPSGGSADSVVGAAVGKLVRGQPGKLLLSKMLHRFKSLAETGEVPTLTHQPAARDGGRDT